MANRHVAERYATALANWDIESLRELVHPDIVVRYPQSGETFEGIDSYLAATSCLVFSQSLRRAPGPR